MSLPDLSAVILLQSLLLIVVLFHSPAIHILHETITNKSSCNIFLSQPLFVLLSFLFITYDNRLIMQPIFRSSFLDKQFSSSYFIAYYYFIISRNIFSDVKLLFKNLGYFDQVENILIQSSHTFFCIIVCLIGYVSKSVALTIQNFFSF